MKIANVDKILKHLQYELEELRSYYLEMDVETPEARRSASRVYGRICGIQYAIQLIKENAIEI